METYEDKYKDLVKRLNKAREKKGAYTFNSVLDVVAPELKIDESEDERIRKEIIDFLGLPHPQFVGKRDHEKWIAWLEKQGSEPNWCHHNVDLSNCSEEYRKAYYDGWNNCNMQHSQCKSDGNDVVKCLTNGMNFYYKDNEEATWGTEKFSMKVKDILSWLEKQGGHANFISKIQVGDKVTRNEDGVLVNLSQLNRVAKKDEKQGEQKPAWSEEDEDILNTIINHFKVDIECTDEDDVVRWLKSLKGRYTWKPSDAQMASITCAVRKMKESACYDSELVSLFNDLKKLKGE